MASNVRAGQSGLDAFFKLELRNSSVMPEIGRVVDLEVTLPAEQQVVALPVQSLYANDRIYEVVEDDRLQGISVRRIGNHRASARVSFGYAPNNWSLELPEAVQFSGEVDPRNRRFFAVLRELLPTL